MRRRSFPVNHRRTAFTLIELMVVIIIIAVMSAMIVTEMSGGLKDALLRSSSRQLISVFHLASSRAISINRPHRVRFDRVSGRYLIEKHGRGAEFVPADDVPDAEGVIDSRISLRVQDAEDIGEAPSSDEAGRSESPAENAVNFYADGTSDGRQIELRDRDGFGLALRVSAITARVQIVELQRQ